MGCVLLWRLDKMSFSTAQLHKSQFITRNRTAFFMVHWLKALLYLAIEEKISAFTMWDPLSQPHCFNLRSSFDKASSFEGPFDSTSDPCEGKFTDRKRLVYDQGRCGSIPDAYSQYPAALLLFLCSSPQLRQIGPFGILRSFFFPYCDLKLYWIFLHF